MLISEVIHLPDEQWHTIRRLQFDYISEWVRLLLIEHAELTEPEARVVVLAVLGIVNDIARIRRLRERRDLADDLLTLGRATLLDAR